MADRVFSVTDFKEGLDVRKTPLTAPGGSLRILENAVLNQGGEVEKRLAFVPMFTIPEFAPPERWWLIGHGGALHGFGFTGVDLPGSPLPVPMYWHMLSGFPADFIEITDVEPFDDKFFVCARGTDRNYCWYDGNPVHEADGSLSGGTLARTWKSKMYRLDGKYLRFSGINNPAQNDPASVTEPGAGFINLALNDPEGEDLIGMEVFYADMALFSRLQTQIFTLDPDPTKDTLKQLLRIGNLARHSVLQFGTGDVLFLSASGVRSLKGQTLNFSAAVSDVGSSIDLALIPLIRGGWDGTLPVVSGPVSGAAAIVQPVQGRYWLAIGDTIYVLSYFPAGHITAWSTFKPGFAVKNFASVAEMVFCRGADNGIYLYGGVDQATYDSSKVTIRTPHLSADDPTQHKRIKSIDVMCQGQWTVSIGMLPNNTEAFELCATIQDNTYGLMSIPFAGYGTHFGVHLEHQAPGPALMAALHFNIQEGVVK